jgi:osmotically-inducible protein OsmY
MVRSRRIEYSDVIPCITSCGAGVKRKAVDSTHGGIDMRHFAFLILALLLSGCFTIASMTYDVATDERSIGKQADDAGIWSTIKGGLLQSDVSGTGDMHVFCHNGIVVLAGVVEHGSEAGKEAVKIARRTQGVRKIHTYFLKSQPDPLTDFAIKEKIHFKMVEDFDLTAGQVDMAVIDGHVVLVGVVDSRAKTKKIIAIARTTTGVRAVKSFIQTQR